MKHVITVLIEGEDGSITKHTREFGGFKRDMKALIGWLTECRVELVILESTGIYWKSVFAHLEAAGRANSLSDIKYHIGERKQGPVFLSE
jgi:transposase